MRYTKWLGALCAIGVLCFQAGLARAAPESGFWWNPNEGGRGFAIEVQGVTLFMGAFLYEANGRATWYSSAGPLQADGSYQGTLQAYGNGQTLTGAYKANAVTNANAGNIALQFSDATHGTLTWPGGTIPIERFVFGSGTPSFKPESGIWWNAAESGRGFLIEVQGTTLWLGGYMYDDAGNPVWYAAPGPMTSTTLFQGHWEQYSGGQTLTGAYFPPASPPANAGNVTLQFTSTTTATLTLPDARQIQLTRFYFAPSGPTTAIQNSAQALDGVALGIYDTLIAKQDLKPYISGVMTAFGVPPLGEADVATVDARFSLGLPLMFIPQVAEMADAFNDGGYISLDSFIASANERGAKQKGTTNPLTRDYLNQKFAAFAGKTQYASGEVLPAFVLALGKERAKRFLPANPDPLWGDGLLDPLQLTLMLYAVSYSSAAPLPAQAPLLSVAAYSSAIVAAAAVNPIEEFVKDQIKDQVEGAVQDFVEVPLSKEDAARVSVCASLLLYGHKVKVTATPNLIWHHQTDGTAPWSTRVEALLTFQDDYWDNYLPIDRWLLNNLGNCTLPQRGPVEGKPIVWSVSDGLIAHGSYNITPAATDDDGKGVANWQTVEETTPKAQRTFTNQRDAVGAAIVRAGSLVPGWSGLERIVGLLKDTGNTGDSPLTVMYYVDPCKGEQASQAALVCWSGTGSMNSPITSYTAQVTWTLESTDNKVATYRPNGTVSVVVGAGCSYNPSSVTNLVGVLIVDYNANPPTYYGFAGTSPYTVALICDGELVGYESTAAPWFGGSGGPGGQAAAGVVSPDGATIEGSDISGDGLIWNWKFTRNQ